MATRRLEHNVAVYYALSPVIDMFSGVRAARRAAPPRRVAPPLTCVASRPLEACFEEAVTRYLRGGNVDLPAIQRRHGGSAMVLDATWWSAWATALDAVVADRVSDATPNRVSDATPDRVSDATFDAAPDRVDVWFTDGHILHEDCDEYGDDAFYATDSAQFHAAALLDGKRHLVLVVLDDMYATDVMIGAAAAAVGGDAVKVVTVLAPYDGTAERIDLRAWTAQPAVRAWLKDDSMPFVVLSDDEA